MKYYVEAYYGDGTPILGNLDGQGIIHSPHFRRTNYFKWLSGNILKGWAPRPKKPAFWHIVTPDNIVVHTIYNKR